jgi:hypothetical protein
MGRGLSDLQRFILKETAKQGVLFRRDIKARFFGFKPRTREHEPDERHQRKIPSRGYNDYLKRVKHDSDRGYAVFSPIEIGKKKYNSTAASIGRSLTRLQQRGLIEPYWRVQLDGWKSFEWGILLTEDGEVYVKQKFSIKAKKIRKPKEPHQGYFYITNF